MILVKYFAYNEDYVIHPLLQVGSGFGEKSTGSGRPKKKIWILTTASELIVDMKILIEKQTKHAWIFIWFSHRVKLRENLQKTNTIVSRWVELDPEPEYLDTPYWFCWWPWIHGQHVYPYVRLLTGHVSVVYCPSLRRKVVNCLD